MSCIAPYIPASLPSCASSKRVSRHAWKQLSLKCFWIVSIKICPALDTPPPITITSGLVTLAKDIFDVAKEGDEVALGLVDEVGEILGSTLSNIACVTNPEVIVIGGGVYKSYFIAFFCQIGRASCRERV